MQRMKLYSCNIIRLVLFLIPLGVAIYIFVMLSGMRIRGQQHVNMLSEQLRNRTFAQIENTATMFLPLNYSASSLARGLSSSLNETQLPFTTVQSTVAPLLFLAFQTTPFLTQITYVGQDKLMFSFYTEQGHDDDQTFAVFCNSSSSATWYSQPVNRDTGMLYGQPTVVDEKEFDLKTLYGTKESLKGTMGYASKSSIGPGLNKAKKELFFNTAAIDGRAQISMGFPVEYVDERFAFVKFYGVDFHLASNNGQVLVDTRIPDTSIIVYNGSVSVQLNNLNGTSQDLSGNQSCKVGDGERGQFKVKIKKEFMFYCSVIELAGLESVYTVAYTAEGMGTDVLRHNDQAYLLLVILFAIVKVSLCVFIIIVFKAASREMFLCAALIKQMESTHQAERKSIIKSLAFAAASHDIRNGFANITCRIDHCLNEAASTDSDLAANLKLIDKETSGLVDILNDVLDASKIEAGKMPLKVEEFDLAELLENIVDLHYYRAVEKGVDLILDPCDNSLAKFCLVKGDKVKLIQILNNLLMNAIKFTAEGHVTVRASVRKPSKENAFIVCNHHSSLNFLTKLRTKNCCKKTLNGFPAIQQNPNCMEFLFEVDDTGKGIPKEKQKDIFENFVQVKETAPGEGGYGLGLGIVQSLVHLMGGEIKIADKRIGERGTCFQFNIFLTACIPVSAEAEEQENNAQNHGLRNYLYHHFGLQFRSSPSRLEGCHVVLFVAGEERRKVISSHIDSMHIKVLEVRNLNDLVPTLDRLKRKLDLSSSSLEKSEVSLNLTTETTNEVHDHSTVPRCKKSSSKGSSNFILVIIDSRAGPLLELSSSVVNFKKDPQNLTWKFVLLQDHVSNSSSRAEEPQENRPLVPPPFDYVFQKPLHGKRLYEVLSLLPEYGNSVIQHARKTGQEIECQEFNSKDLSMSQLTEIVIRDGNKMSTSMDLKGKKVLVVDDQELLCTYASTCVQKLGADVDVCENGKEAFDKVCKSLNQLHGNDANNTYDLILMDCEMPHMNGYEATRLIREVEEKHGMHIPIIALTAHTMDDEMSLRIKDAGMDYYLTKPLNIQELYAFINRP